MLFLPLLLYKMLIWTIFITDLIYVASCIFNSSCSEGNNRDVKYPNRSNCFCSQYKAGKTKNSAVICTSLEMPLKCVQDYRFQNRILIQIPVSLSEGPSTSNRASSISFEPSPSIFTVIWMFFSMLAGDDKYIQVQHYIYLNIYAWSQ